MSKSGDNPYVSDVPYEGADFEVSNWKGMIIKAMMQSLKMVDGVLLNEKVVSLQRIKRWCFV